MSAFRFLRGIGGLSKSSIPAKTRRGTCLPWWAYPSILRGTGGAGRGFCQVRCGLRQHTGSVPTQPARSRCATGPHSCRARERHRASTAVARETAEGGSKGETRTASCSESENPERCERVKIPQRGEMAGASSQRAGIDFIKRPNAPGFWYQSRRSGLSTPRGLKTQAATKPSPHAPITFRSLPIQKSAGVRRPRLNNYFHRSVKIIVNLFAFPLRLNARSLRT